MAFETLNVREFLQAIRNEPLKMYRLYDGSNRVSMQYETLTHISVGGPCMKTEYVYDGASNRILKMEETIDTWTLSMEI